MAKYDTFFRFSKCLASDRFSALPDLAQDKEFRVRVAVAKQQRTPLDVLKVLPADDDVKLCKVVHKNGSAIVEIKVEFVNCSATDEIKAFAALIGVK